MYKTQRDAILVILSGGMDSTTLLYRAIATFNEVEAISFNYGQRHKRELEVAEATCKLLGVNHKIVDVSVLRDVLGGSALTDDIAVPEGHYADDNMKVTVVPNRNSIFANIAAGYAISRKIPVLGLGVHRGDHHIYPDCRPVFVERLEALLEVANYDALTVWTPYLNDTKVDIVKDGLTLGVDYKLTHTCYNGREIACGRCGSCVERLEAFKENDATDPVAYESVKK